MPNAAGWSGFHLPFPHAPQGELEIASEKLLSHIVPGRPKWPDFRPAGLEVKGCCLTA